MTDRHKEFAEAMRNIMRHNEEKEKAFNPLLDFFRGWDFGNAQILKLFF